MATLLEQGFQYSEWNGKTRIKCLICKKTYKVIGQHIDDHHQMHVAKGEEIPMTAEEQKPKPEDQLKDLKVAEPEPLTEPLKRAGYTLGQEEYEAIKELLYRGETVQEIVGRSSRSVYTVRKILESSSYEDYKERQRAKSAYVPVSVAKKEPPRYYRLKEAREAFDEVLIEFIKQELIESEKLLVKRIDELEKENERLQGVVNTYAQRIEEMEKPSFTSKLHQTLSKKEEDNG